MTNHKRGEEVLINPLPRNGEVNLQVEGLKKADKTPLIKPKPKTEKKN